MNRGEVACVPTATLASVARAARNLPPLFVSHRPTLKRGVFPSEEGDSAIKLEKGGETPT